MVSRKILVKWIPGEKEDTAIGYDITGLSGPNLLMDNRIFYKETFTKNGFSFGGNTKIDGEKQSINDNSDVFMAANNVCDYLVTSQDQEIRINSIMANIFIEDKKEEIEET